MEDKRYQIFISSTYEDLKSARQKVLETILSLYHFPIGMEMFSADDAEQWEIIKQTIDRSDYYIVLIGHRYGSETSDGIGYTEKEYDYAREQGIPALAFVRKRNIATKPDERETDQEKIKKLEKFIEKATRSRMCDFWDNEEDLGRQVAVALIKIFNRMPRIGWVRSDQATSPIVSEEIANLSRENREIREELAQLQEQLGKKVPQLEVVLNEGKRVDFLLKNSDKMVVQFNKRPIEIGFQDYPSELKRSTIPAELQSYITDKEIAEYNKSLPSNETVDKWNRELEMFWRVKETACDLPICVRNTGETKANDIFVDITFPKTLMVLTKRDITSYKLPDNPFPYNPLIKAKEKFHKYQQRREDPFSFLSDVNNFTLSQGIPQLFDSHLKGISKSISDIKKPFTFNISNNRIHIRIDSLLHTRHLDFGQVAVIPFATGDCDVNVSVMCEEYSVEQLYTLVFHVGDDVQTNKS